MEFVTDEQATADTQTVPATQDTAIPPRLSDTPAFVDALHAYETAATAYYAALHTDGGLDTWEKWNALESAYTDAYNTLTDAIRAHAHPLDKAASEACDRSTSRPNLPAYIGRAAHLFQANKRAVQDVIQDAIGQRVNELTLTLVLPLQTRVQRRLGVRMELNLPVAHGFDVVQTEGFMYYKAHSVDTWEEAVAYIQANRHDLPSHLKWNICSRDAQGYTIDSDLLGWQEKPTTETPPTGEAVQPRRTTQMQQALMEAYPVETTADAATQGAW